MPKIRVLPDILASQVAAGEVVERPASVVKELVENSIDAGAREVRVDVDRGGAALIRVSDDGCGMSREDALLSLERHATSKLRTSGDLAAIRTLGFRGEAVPSIASVSRFRIVTRERDAMAGTEITVEGGKLRDVKDAGCAPGTVIEAKALFFNMPARRKFMRAESTEAAHVEHQLRMHALAAPTVRFRLRRDDRDVFDLPPVAKAVDRVRQLLGPELAGELIALPLTHRNGVSVEGFVLPASHARKGRRHQYVFLNGRPVEDAVISRALAEGFRGAVADGLHPAAWVWLELEPALVDVNVHPAKREVRFHRPLDVKEVILESVLEALRPVSVAVPKPVPRLDLPEVGAVEVAVPESRSSAPRQMERMFRETQPVLPKWTTAEVMPEIFTKKSESIEEDVGGDTGAPLDTGTVPFQVLGLLHGRYVVLQGEDGLVVLDPRAAKERIFYERMLAGESGSLEVQHLLVPVLLELDPREADLVLREREAMLQAGIEIEAFGGNTLQILSVPACLKVDSPREFLGALLDEMLHDPAPGARFATDRLARVLAKRAAVGTVAKLAEVPGLLTELFNCELPYCTAEGKPTLTELSLKELERRFAAGSR
ncbi:MAG: DNA mismatch repair endonuclease MutL [Luteolibacter sp.]